MVLGGAAGALADPPDFVRDIRPLLDRSCVACHSGEQAKSGLRLDLRARAFAGGDGHGAAIEPGQSGKSPLVRFARGDEPGMRMPPADASEPPLSPDEVTLLAAWVDAGALWPDGVDRASLVDRRDHWAFRGIVPPAPPAVRDGAWPHNDIDRFILARLDAEGLAPAPEADRLTWLRRVTLDLIGLPPTPEEIDSFLADRSPGAVERVADRLLASPRHGERMAQHWLDVVRYADTHGYEVNTERANAWPYRDWVVAAFNTDMPYDTFVRRQLAGDADRDDAPTGFLVTAAVLLPGQIGADDASKRLARQDALNDILINTGESFLGLSIGCARCHDHKFDPVSVRDYHSLQAVFSGVHYEDRELHSPAADGRRAEIATLRGRLAELQEARTAHAPLFGTEPPATATSPSEADRQALAAIEAEEAELKGRIAALDKGLMVFGGRFAAPDPARVLHRGDPEQPGEEVGPRSPAAFDDTLPPLALPTDAPEQARRVALADWIVHPANPLAARVIANRIWQWHFGTGLVETASDFGRSGTSPSHPELLDWLATELVARDWSLKSLHRLIVLSATYRQGHAATPEGLARDADSRLLWRYPSRRLEAEAIRDSMLAVSGLLDPAMGGRGFDLFRSRGGLDGFAPVETFSGEGLKRMIYAHKVRMEKESVFGAFDCPDAGQTMARRRQSTTPIQALNLVNSPFTIQVAEAFAARVERETAAGEGDTPERQAATAVRLALGRAPTPEEFGDGAALVREHSLSALCRVLINTSEFVTLP